MISNILSLFNAKKELNKMTLNDKVEALKSASMRAMEALKAARKAILELQANHDDHSAEIADLKAKIAAMDARKAIDDQAIEALTFAWDALLADNGGSMGGIKE
jgi:chromosome segregation ATPase